MNCGGFCKSTREEWAWSKMCGIKNRLKEETFMHGRKWKFSKKMSYFTKKVCYAPYCIFSWATDNRSLKKLLPLDLNVMFYYWFIFNCVNTWYSIFFIYANSPKSICIVLVSPLFKHFCTLWPMFEYSWTLTFYSKSLRKKFNHWLLWTHLKMPLDTKLSVSF